MTDPCRPNPSSPRPRDVTWTRSTHCGPSGGCVEVALDDGVVLVRDSKLGADSPVQEWTPAEWCDLLLASAKSGLWCEPNFTVAPAGTVALGRLKHADWLHFDRDEWAAFTAGMKAGEFDLARLLPGFKTSSGVGERSGVGDAPAAAATGAGGGAVLPVPVAAAVDVYASSGVCRCGADGDSPCVCPSLNVPAGRADAEEGDRPGLTDEDEPPDSPARRAARVALRRVYDNGIFQESIGMGDVLDACSDAAIDTFLETTLAEAARPLGAGS